MNQEVMCQWRSKKGPLGRSKKGPLFLREHDERGGGFPHFHMALEPQTFQGALWDCGKPAPSLT